MVKPWLDHRQSIVDHGWKTVQPWKTVVETWYIHGPLSTVNLIKKLKLSLHQLNSQNNGPVLLFKSIFMH